jgi:hypothetical protein
MFTDFHNKTFEKCLPVVASARLFPNPCHSSAILVYKSIPAGLATNETWMLRGRKAVPKTPPAGYFHPEDFVPERFGYEEGIPLYGFDQTRSYNPKPATIAAQQYYDFFVASQNRNRHSRWDDGKRKNRSDVKPTWLTYDKYLSRAKIRDHLRGKDIFGCWGNLWTNWFAIDIDYHGGDLALFLVLLDILKELGDFFPGVRWAYVLNRNGISGLHMIGLLPTPRLLEQIRLDVQKVLVYLEDENSNALVQFKPEGIQHGDFHPLAGLELYPATNHNFRLPYAADRITITDQWLNRPCEVSLKPNLVQFMDYVKDKDRQAVPLAEVIDYIRANVQWKPPKTRQSSGKATGTRKNGGGTGMGKIEPLKGRHLEFITGVVLGTEAMPNDTIGSWAAPALRHLILVDGLDADEALEKLEQFYEMIPDKDFSDRLSGGDIGSLLRSDAYTVSKIEDGNLGQSRPDESTETFAKVKAYCERIGFVFADPSTWHVLKNRKHVSFDISDVDYSLTFEEKLAIKEPGTAILKCDISSVYQAAHFVKAFVTKYPGKELPATLVPHLCAALSISWYIPSDEGTRCKKAERFLKLLCRLSIIKLIKPKQWYGPGHPANSGAVYGLPKDTATSDLGRQWYQTWWTRIVGEQRAVRVKGESIYITDSSRFIPLDITEVILEVERLNRPWKPQYHSSG